MSGANTDAERGRTGVTSAEKALPEERIEQDRESMETHPVPSQSSLVLIAEDEEPIAEAIALIVGDAGYTPLVAVHGKQALELARLRRPDLVITDLMMPHLDGAELISALRSDAQRNGYAPPPIILMTAAGMRRAYEAEADALLRKPFELADLEMLLLRYLGSPENSE